ncbi:MAG: LPS heptosyltransferase [Bacteroidia bacterium]|nr:MAG: LPS heptosyltransferase [Bacteroidia bacterium]
MKIHLPNNASILISRTDSIGDVILTIPITYALKKLYPANKIIFLCSNYTKPILDLIQTIDYTISVEELQTFTKSEQHQFVIKHNFHTSIIVFPSYSISKLIYSLKIPYRISTSHRWYNWLYCNQKVSFSRKKSDLHEAQLNFKLLQPLGIQKIPTIEELTNYYIWKPIPPLPKHLSQLLNPDKFKLIIHPKSKGSAREWGIQNYINLIKILDKSKFQIIITGTKQEEKFLEPIIKECPEVLNLAGKTSLEELISLINACDALIAASTGTLHIAATLGKHAIGLFPSIRPMHAGRWAPIGKHTYILHQNKFCNDCKNNPELCHCIQSISTYHVADILNSILLKNE